MNAGENVALPLSFRGISKSERIKRAKKYLELVGLEKFMNHMPNQMSGGQQQRVGIARALVVDPEIIFADEPTGNLDSKNRDVILSLFRQEQKEGRAIVMITHDTEAARAADQVLLLEGGALYEA